MKSDINGENRLKIGWKLAEMSRKASRIFHMLKLLFKVIVSNLNRGGSRGGWSWALGPPPPFGEPPNFIKREKKHCAHALKYAAF